MKGYKPLILLLCLSTIWCNYKLFESSLHQAYIMYDYNSATTYYPLDLVNEIDSDFPNVTLTTLPIKFLQARYYAAIDSTEQAKKMFRESMNININPYLTAGEGELANLYLKEEKYDSAYYYSKIAFDNIPNSNVHRHAYFEVLEYRKDTIELLNAFNKLKKYDNDNHWKEYMLKRYEIVGPGDKDVLETFDQYKSRFNLDNDESTNIFESILKVGDKNVVVSVAISLKADTLFQEKKYIQSAKLYELALEVDKNDYTFYENAAIAYNMAGEYDKAEFYFDKVINDFKPLNGKAEFYKGIMMIKLNDTDTGCILLKKAIDLQFSGDSSVQVYNNFCN